MEGGGSPDSMSTLVTFAALLVLALAGGELAEAGGTKVIIRFGAPSRHHQHPPRVVVPRGPVHVLPGPVYVVRPQRCRVPGSWAYAWVPQSYSYNVWVDGQYSSDGLWVAGDWEPRVYTSGSYQPYWIPERWTYC